MRKLTALLTIAMALLAALPAAASQRDRTDDRNRYDRADRRVSVDGRVRSVSRERDGVRVYLDRGNYSFFVPASIIGRRQFRVGMEVRLAGVLRAGTVWVDDVGWPMDGQLADAIVVGRVERLNPFEQRMVVRDERGKLIDVDARSLGSDERRSHRLDFSDVRRGQRVTLRGRWERGTFRASRIESISPR